MGGQAGEVAEAVGVDLLARILASQARSHSPAGQTALTVAVEMGRVMAMGMGNFQEEVQPLVRQSRPLRQPRPAREHPGKVAVTMAEKAETPIQVRTRLL